MKTIFDQRGSVFERKDDNGGNDDIGAIAAMIKSQGDQISEFKTTTQKQVDELEEDVRQLVLKAGRPSIGGGAGDGQPASKAVQTWLDTKTQRQVPVFSHKQSVAAYDGKAKDDLPSFGRIMRGIILGSQAPDAKALEEERKALGISVDPSGGYTVPGALSGIWIDALRAQMVLSQAGCMTVPMETAELTLAKLTADPTAYWRNENANVTAGEPTFGAVNLRAKTVACLVKLSLELSQDSPNIDSILASSITKAMAGAIDSAGMVGVTTDAAAAPAGIFNLADRNKVLAIGTPAFNNAWDFLTNGMYELMVDNVQMQDIGAMIGHPKLWQHLTKLRDSTGQPLAFPDDVTRLPKLWTTAAPFDGTTAKAVVADWRDYLFGIRQNIEVRVLREAFLGSNLQVAVLAVARVDFAATRAQSFCTLEGITFT